MRKLRLSMAALLFLVSPLALSFDLDLNFSVASDDVDLERGVVQILAFGVDSAGKVTLSTGSGALLNSEGYVVTNVHVISGAKRLYVNPNGARVNPNFALNNPNAVLVVADANKDLAILKVERLDNVQPAMLSTRVPAKGDAVSAVGYPGVADDKDAGISGEIVSDATVTRGVLSRAKNDTTWAQGKGLVKTIQHTAPISWGNSGGPLLDECGRVLALNTQGTFTDARVKVIASGYYWSVRVEELIDILNSRNITYTNQNYQCLKPTGLLWRVLWVGVAVLFLLTLFIVLLWRRPRERIIQIAERLSNYQRVRPENPVPSPRPHPIRKSDASLAGFSVSLEGVDSSGQRHVLNISPEMLMAGVVVGRAPPDRSLAIPVSEISREHVRINYKDGAVYVRDLDSSNGTKLSGRSISSRRSELLAQGDTLELGPVLLKVKFKPA